MTARTEVRPPATAEELAAYLQLKGGKNTLRDWRYRGRGPKFVKVGRGVRYHWSDVEAWMNGTQKAAAVAPATARTNPAH